jgi:protein-disulfide isomerase
MRPFSRRLALAAALGVAVMTAGAGSAQVTADDMTLGNPAAKVTVIEYASTACPHCARWNAEVWPAFKAKYVDTGKVRYVYREFVTSPPQLAIAGPLLARCAGKAKYFSVMDAAFRAQEAVYAAGNIQPLLKVGRDAGLSEDQIKACLTDQAALNAMQARIETYTERDKINATPTFVINGAKLEGEQPLEALDAAIAAAK